MRIGAFIPVVLCTVALILSFLCLFAGNSRDFMQDYAILTLNTSRLGENLLNASHHSSNPFVSILDNVTNSIEGELDNDINDIARALGLRDWYAIHVLDYCEGYYEPGPLPNATVPRSSIYENTTYCSNSSARFHFNPQNTLQAQLNNSGHSDISLEQLGWPNEINTGLHDLSLAFNVVFVLYCIGIGMMFITLALSVGGLFSKGRPAAFSNVIVDWLAFLAIGIASAVVTGIAVKAAHLINHYGNDIGVSAQQGNKFLALTWATTAVVLVACLVWCFECVVGNRKHSKHQRLEKDG